MVGVGRGVVEVCMSPNPALVATVRAVATDVAGRVDFDWAATADLRMAVDEACSTLVGLADPSATVSCVFTLAHNHIGVRLSTYPATCDAAIDTQGFGWRILTTLVDQLHISRPPTTRTTSHTDVGGSGAVNQLVILLSKNSH